MVKRVLIFVPELVLILSLMSGCEREYPVVVQESLEEPEDYIFNTDESVNIYLNGSSISVEGPGASVVGSTVTITKGAIYTITGTLTDGQLIIDSDDTGIVRLVLNGSEINCSYSSPINIKKSYKTVICLAQNTSNILRDGTSYMIEEGENEPNAALFSKSYVSIFGSGSLSVEGRWKDGITSKDGLVIKSGTISVCSADDGIRGKDYIVIRDGNISITANGDGLRSDNDVDPALGFITIEGGVTNITSGCDGISAETKVSIRCDEINIQSGGGSSHTANQTLSAKGIKGTTSVEIYYGALNINSSDDAIHSHGPITVNDGSIIISTADDGLHSDTNITINGGDITVNKSYESIEAPAILVSSGNIHLTASNDGFNASKGNGGERDDGSSLTINGGYSALNVSNGDGLDSNGSMTMTGGTVIVHGPQSQPEVGMDVNGICNISGGTLTISGTNSNMTEAPAISSSQYSLMIKTNSGLSSSTVFHIQDAEAREILTFQPLRTYYSVIFSSNSLVNGFSYQIYTGGTSTGIITDGVYSGGVYSGGTLRKTFTVTGKITNISF